LFWKKFIINMFVVENRKSIGRNVFFLFGSHRKLLNRLFSLESFNLILIPINSNNLYLFGQIKKLQIHVYVILCECMSNWEARSLYRAICDPCLEFRQVGSLISDPFSLLHSKKNHVYHFIMQTKAEKYHVYHFIMQTNAGKKNQ